MPRVRNLDETAPVGTAPKDMVWVPDGTFWMGSDRFYPEERPSHQVHVDGFWMDRHPVTVAEFRRFVKATGYVTTAEVPPNPDEFAEAAPALLVPGALVFTPPPGPVPLDDYRRWWAWMPGADWRHPEGPHSNLDGRQHHPVTQISYRDAAAYAAWAGKALPTEAEWEFAARGGADRADYAWGDARHPGRGVPANVWQGEFPWQNLKTDPIPGTTRVGRFDPNGYGLVDMSGNVWEWTEDFFTPDHSRGGKAASSAACCIPRNPRVVRSDVGDAQRPQRVIKGGSFLCAPNYCLRYRPSARQGQDEDTATCHIGLRCVRRARTV
ncbi:formylglycine-generating enzyme family protein [Nocardia carnea]|uniref:formylglycine-generating enzyme family protein n=1 Tax=Nocardia carnea TaxID=37328 RepID=UPI003D788215